MMDWISNLFGGTPKDGDPQGAAAAASGADAAGQNMPEADFSQPAQESSAKTEIPSYWTYSNDELLNCFSNGWADLKNPQREALLQEVSARYASAHGISIPLVRLDETMSSDLLGGYANGKIDLNPAGLNNPYEALDTVIHETNHHIQNQNAASHTGSTEDRLALFTCEGAAGGYGKGEGSEDEETYYNLQALEADSNNAGFACLAENFDRFQSDPKYLEYLQGREEHFKTMKDDYEKNPAKWQGMEKAYIMNSGKGGVDLDTRARAIAAVENGPDAMKQESFENAGEARQLRQKCETHQAQQMKAAANQHYQKSADLMDNPNVTQMQLSGQYQENAGKLSEIESKLAEVNSRLEITRKEMTQMHYENDGKPGWRIGIGENPVNHNEKYAALVSEFNHLSATKDTLTTGRNMLAASNEELNAKWQSLNQEGQSPAQKFRDSLKVPAGEQSAVKGSAASQGTNNAQDGAPEEPQRERDHPGAEDDERMFRKADGAQQNDGEPANIQSHTQTEQQPQELAAGGHEEQLPEPEGQTEEANGISAPQQETPAREESAEETNGISAPQQETPAQEKNAEKANGISAPQQETPAQEKSAEEANGISAPQQEPLAQEKNAEEANGISSPQQETPAQEKSAEEANGISGSDSGISGGEEQHMGMSE